MKTSEDITDLLAAWNRGETEALDRLLPQVYQRLRGLAASFLRNERPDHTLHTLDLVHESFLRLTRQREVEWKGQAHFFGLAGQMMRRILVDHARRRKTEKWGGGALCSLDPEFDLAGEERPIDLLALDEALNFLEKNNPELARIVELRYFLGLGRDEAAEALGLSISTFNRRWQLGRRWLYSYLVKGRRDVL